MALVLNTWVEVGSASQTKTLPATGGGYVNIKLTYHLEAMLTSQSETTGISKGKVRARVTRDSGTGYSSSNVTASCLNCATYSNSGTISISDNTLTTGTFTLYCDDNGDAALHLAGTFTAYNGSYSISVDAWMGAPNIPRASTPTFSANPLTIGSTQTITTNRASSSFTHTLDITVGEYTESITDVGASTTWTPSAADLMPYMTSYQMTASVVCTTYSGSTKIGTKTTSFVLQVDTDTYKPVIGTVTTSDTNATTTALETSGQFISGYSNISASIVLSVNDSGYSSTLASAAVTLGSASTTYTLSGTSQTITFTASGITSGSLVIAVTDSRGYTATTTKALTVISYSAITISSITTERVNSGGVASETGEYISYEIKCTAYDGSFGQSYNAIVVSTESKAASASTYNAAVTEQTVTTSGAGEMAEITITGITVGQYTPSSQFDIKFTLTDALSSATFAALRIHEGVPVFAWGEDHFDVYGELHIHDRDDVTVYSVFDHTGYPWNLVGSASGSNAVAISQTNYSELMLVAKYVENANYTWVASSTIPLAELSADSIYLMMPARISTSTGYDKGCVVKVSTTSANIFEFISDRANISGMTLSVYYR